MRGARTARCFCSCCGGPRFGTAFRAHGRVGSVALRRGSVVVSGSRQVERVWGYAIRGELPDGGLQNRYD
jgi:hypothetical protein